MICRVIQFLLGKFFIFPSQKILKAVVGIAHFEGTSMSKDWL